MRLFKELELIVTEVFSNENFNKKIIDLSFVLSILYFFIRIIDNFIIQQANLGDEYFFYRDLEFYIANGYSLSVLKGISIPFTLFSNLIYYFISDISLSLRLANSTIVVLLIIYLLNRKNLINRNNIKIFFIHFFILIGSAGGSFQGTNDSFFILSCIIIFCEYYLSFKGEKVNSVILTTAFTIFILSRPIFIIFLFSLFVSVLLFLFIKYGFKKKIIKKIKFYNFVFGILIALLFNYPRFINPQYLNNQNGYLPKFLILSYSDKSGTYKVDDPGFSWVQWHYYSQLVANENGLGLFSPLLPWDEVRKYKIKYGDEVLPKSYSDYVFNYFLFSLERIPGSIFETFIISIRFVGGLLFLLPLWLIFQLHHNKKESLIFMSLIIFCSIISWAFIIPRALDHRWLLPSYTLLLIIFTNQKNYKPSLINEKYMLLNTILLDIIVLWALWKWRIFYNI